MGSFLDQVSNEEFILVFIFTVNCFKKMGPLTVTAMKLIIDLLCALIHLSHTILTPFSFHVPLIGSSSLLAFALSF